MGMHDGSAVPRRVGEDLVGAPRAGQLRWDDQQVVPRRLRSSISTFGPVGRVVATGLVVLFVLWFFALGPFVFFLVPALPVVVWVVREIWAKAPVDRGPSPTAAPDLGGRVARGPADPVQPQLWTSWEAPSPSEPDAVPREDAVEEPQPDVPLTEAERLAIAHLLDPRLAAAVRDRPAVVPPPFPGAAQQRPQADGTSSAAPA